MYVMEYLIYHLKPYGINARFSLTGDADDWNTTAAPLSATDEQTLYERAWRAALRARGADDTQVREERPPFQQSDVVTTGDIAPRPSAQTTEPAMSTKPAQPSVGETSDATHRTTVGGSGSAPTES